MRLTTRSEYGLICLRYLCHHAERAPISLAEITEKEKLPKDYVEQIFMRLRRAGIVQSQKGIHGGFALARPAAQITMKEIFETLEGSEIFEVFCGPEVREKIVCEHYSECSVRPVWSKIAEIINRFCAAVTLDLLIQDEPSVMARLEKLVQGVEESQRPAAPLKSAAPKPIYMDNHATTPLDPRVFEVMLPCFKEDFGNAASRSHPYGWEAGKKVEKARAQVAKLLGAEAREIVFTSGATESINLAMKGAAENYREKGNHIITQATEHKAVLDSARYLETKGFRVTVLGVDAAGRINLEELERAITPETILISIMHANNEIGTLQPVEAVGKIAKARGILFHVDAAQSAGKIPLDVERMGIDLLSLTAHKLYGPKGAGALYVRRKNPNVRLTALCHGGGHENGMRSGTLNVAGIAGLGAACEIAQAEMAEESGRLIGLRERLKTAIEAQVDEVTLNGHPTERLPGNLNLSFSYVEGEALLMSLCDTVAVSSGSACSSASVETSHVLKALGNGTDLMYTAVRFGLGRFNTAEEVDLVAAKVSETVKKLRELSPVYKAAKKN